MRYVNLSNGAVTAYPDSFPRVWLRTRGHIMARIVEGAEPEEGQVRVVTTGAHAGSVWLLGPIRLHSPGYQVRVHRGHDPGPSGAGEGWLSKRSVAVATLSDAAQVLAEIRRL